jgi:hypothetical protein
MSRVLEGTPPYVRGTFQQTCGFCGCVFSVRVPGRIGYEGPENYYCPECHKKFPVKASKGELSESLKVRNLLPICTKARHLPGFLIQPVRTP